VTTTYGKKVLIFNSQFNDSIIQGALKNNDGEMRIFQFERDDGKSKFSGDLPLTGDLDARGGYKQTFAFSHVVSYSSLVDYYPMRYAGASYTPYIQMPSSGSIRALVINFGQYSHKGNASVIVYKNDVAVAETELTAAENELVKTLTFQKDIVTFTSTDKITVSCKFDTVQVLGNREITVLLTVEF
jgi:hypothetical protein